MVVIRPSSLRSSQLQPGPVATSFSISWILKRLDQLLVFWLVLDWTLKHYSLKYGMTRWLTLPLPVRENLQQIFAANFESIFFLYDIKATVQFKLTKLA